MNSSAGTSGHAEPSWTPNDPEYYNDLPGKVAPDFGPPPPVPPLPNYHAPSGPPVPASSSSSPQAAAASKKGAAAAVVTGRHGLVAAAVDLSDNLIDLNSDLPPVTKTLEAAPEYVNGIMASGGEFKTAHNVKDPFDMRKL